jgi:glucosamine 6-phosphate synthetase-like amidotransferase/phosphosugar isomerase protein
LLSDGESFRLNDSTKMIVDVTRRYIIPFGTDDHELLDVVDHAISIPRTIDMLTPILASVPLQLLAYHIAVLRGTNVDQPRNLAKSVTVE